MPRVLDAPGARVLSLWRRLSPLPGGVWLFNRLLGWMVPYTGALGARVIEVSPGHAVVVLHDRRRVRNHLDSVHAVALVNLAELCSGTAMLTALPAGMRGIVTRLEIDYLKKARGSLRAHSDVRLPDPLAAGLLVPEACIVDDAGDAVARARITWSVQSTSAPASAPVPAPESRPPGASARTTGPR